MDELFDYAYWALSDTTFDAQKQQKLCKVCKRPAWLTWEGTYSDFCSLECREASISLPLNRLQTPEAFHPLPHRYDLIQKQFSQLPRNLQPIKGVVLSRSIAQQWKKRSSKLSRNHSGQLISRTVSPFKPEPLALTSSPKLLQEGKSGPEETSKSLYLKQRHLVPPQVHDSTVKIVLSSDEAENAILNFSEKNHNRRKQKKKRPQKQHSRTLSPLTLENVALTRTQQPSSTLPAFSASKQSQLAEATRNQSGTCESHSTDSVALPKNVEMLKSSEALTGVEVPKVEKVSKQSRSSVAERSYDTRSNNSEQEHKQKMLEHFLMHEPEKEKTSNLEISKNINAFSKIEENSYQGMFDVGVYFTDGLSEPFQFGYAETFQCAVHCPINPKEVQTWRTSWREDGRWEEAHRFELQWPYYPRNKKALIELFKKHSRHFVELVGECTIQLPLKETLCETRFQLIPNRLKNPLSKSPISGNITLILGFSKFQRKSKAFPHPSSSDDGTFTQVPIPSFTVPKITKTHDASLITTLSPSDDSNFAQIPMVSLTEPKITEATDSYKNTEISEKPQTLSAIAEISEKPQASHMILSPTPSIPSSPKLDQKKDPTLAVIQPRFIKKALSRIYEQQSVKRNRIQKKKRHKFFLDASVRGAYSFIPDSTQASKRKYFPSIVTDSIFPDERLSHQTSNKSNGNAKSSRFDHTADTYDEHALKISYNIPSPRTKVETSGRYSSVNTYQLTSRGRAETEICSKRRISKRCSNTKCNRSIRQTDFSDLYEEEEYRQWGICSRCQSKLFHSPTSLVRSLWAARSAIIEPSIYKYDERSKMKIFGNLHELSIYSFVPVAYPNFKTVWPSCRHLFEAEKKFRPVSMKQGIQDTQKHCDLSKFLQREDSKREKSSIPPLHITNDVEKNLASLYAELFVLRICVLLKVEQHPRLQLSLMLTGMSTLQHEVLLHSTNPLNLINNDWDQYNFVGRVLMEKRDSLNLRF